MIYSDNQVVNLSEIEQEQKQKYVSFPNSSSYLSHHKTEYTVVYLF